MINLIEMGKAAKQAAFELSQLSSAQKNHALQLIAEQLEQQKERILEENAKDIQIAKENGLTESLLDRLLLTEDRLKRRYAGQRVEAGTCARAVGRYRDDL